MISKQRESLPRLAEKISRETFGLPWILSYQVEPRRLLLVMLTSAGRKVGEVRGTRRPSVSEQRAPSAETQKNLRLIMMNDDFHPLEDATLDQT